MSRMIRLSRDDGFNFIYQKNNIELENWSLALINRGKEIAEHVLVIIMKMQF